MFPGFSLPESASEDIVGKALWPSSANSATNPSANASVTASVSFAIPNETFAFARMATIIAPNAARRAITTLKIFLAPGKFLAVRFYPELRSPQNDPAAVPFCMVES